MNIPENFHEEFVTALAEATHYVARGILDQDELPSWDMFMVIMDRAGRRSHSKLKDKHPLLHRRVNDVIFTGVHKADVVIDNEDMRDLEQLQELWGLLRKSAPGFHMFEYSKLEITLIGGAPESARERSMHSSDVYLQCRGTSEWRVFTEDDPRAEIEHVVLHPGDMLFIADRYHYSVLIPDASAAVRYSIQSEEN